MDRSLHYLLSRATLGLSPMGLAKAYFDWLVHLSLSPGKQLQLWHKGVRKTARLAAHLARCARQGGRGEPCIEPLPQDKRFDSPAWQHGPSTSSTRRSCCSSSGGTTPRPACAASSAHHERMVVRLRQMLDIFSPSNSS